MPNPPLLLLIGIGLAAGVLSGVFGIGGGVVIVPALIYLAGFRQHVATGTSLAVLLPPVGVAAVVEYYRHGATQGSNYLFLDMHVGKLDLKRPMFGLDPWDFPDPASSQP